MSHVRTVILDKVQFSRSFKLFLCISHVKCTFFFIKNGEVCQWLCLQRNNALSKISRHTSITGKCNKNIMYMMTREVYKKCMGFEVKRSPETKGIIVLHTKFVRNYF